MSYLAYPLVRPILPLFMLPALGCATTYRHDVVEHPKVLAMEKLIRTIGNKAASMGWKAAYFVSMAPRSRDTIKGTGDGYQYEIACSTETIDGAGEATLVEVLTAAGKEPRSAMEVLIWEDGRWKTTRGLSRIPGLNRLFKDVPEEEGPAQVEPIEVGYPELRL